MPFCFQIRFSYLFWLIGIAHSITFTTIPTGVTTIDFSISSISSQHTGCDTKWNSFRKLKCGTFGTQLKKYHLSTPPFQLRPLSSRFVQLENLSIYTLNFKLINKIHGKVKYDTQCQNKINKMCVHILVRENVIFVEKAKIRPGVATLYFQYPSFSLRVRRSDTKWNCSY